MTETSQNNIAVIGGGPGGYAAAFLAADLGMKVTLIDREQNPGGVCVYRGCIPSKALLHVAKLLGEAKHADAWGVTFGDPKIDLAKLRAFKDNVVKRLTSGTGLLAKSRKVQYVQGRGELVDGQPEQVFDRVLVAVGRRPNASVPGLDRTRVALDTRGFIVHDEQMRTAEPSIFAIGDVAGEPMLAHKASHEGRTAVEVIAGHKAAFDPKAIPAVVFT